MSDNSKAIHEEQKTQLLTGDDNSMGPEVHDYDDDLHDEMDAMRPSSSRVKKVLHWHSKH